MAAPSVPRVLFAQDNEIYFEFDTAGCNTNNFRGRYTLDGVIQDAVEDVEFRKGTVYRYFFGTIPLTNYSIISEAVYANGPYGQSAPIVQLSNGPDAPPVIQILVVDYATDTTLQIESNIPIPAGVTLALLIKVVGSPAYVSVPVPYIPGQPVIFTATGLLPDTDYQYFFQASSPQGITNGDIFNSNTQNVGCPTGRPTLIGVNKSTTSITVFSSYANVVGDVQCAATIRTPIGGLLYSTVNIQDVVARTSGHTFNGLFPNTIYTVLSVVENANGFQICTNGKYITTAIDPANPITPDPGYVSTYDSINGGKGVLVSALPNTAFGGNIELTIEFSTDVTFPGTELRNLPYIKIGQSIIASTEDLPPGVPGFFRGKVYDVPRNSIRYTNVLPWDGIGAKRKSKSSSGLQPFPSAVASNVAAQ